jgi:hypothetical protein
MALRKGRYFNAIAAVSSVRARQSAADFCDAFAFAVSISPGSAGEDDIADPDRTQKKSDSRGNHSEKIKASVSLFSKGRVKRQMKN